MAFSLWKLWHISQAKLIRQEGLSRAFWKRTWICSLHSTPVLSLCILFLRIGCLSRPQLQHEFTIAVMTSVWLWISVLVTRVKSWLNPCGTTKWPNRHNSPIIVTRARQRGDQGRFPPSGYGSSPTHDTQLSGGGQNPVELLFISPTGTLSRGGAFGQRKFGQLWQNLIICRERTSDLWRRSLST